MSDLKLVFFDLDTKFSTTPPFKKSLTMFENFSHSETDSAKSKAHNLQSFSRYENGDTVR